jgi:leader peptidase (prepilin peptidase)/N-methyltransferase
MLTFAFGALGLIFGSFINVLVLRRGARTLGGRSECLSCAALLAWYDNIPLLSYVLLRGRCRMCASRISVQYPLVEGATAALFMLVGRAFVGTPFDSLDALALTLALGFTGICIAIAVYDMRHTIIPDSWVFTAAGTALLLSLLGREAGTDLVLSLAAGPIAALLLFALWLISGGKWMGLGDAKLAVAIGWLLGAYTGFIAVVFAFMLGAAITVPLLALSSRGWKEFLLHLTPTRLSEKLFLRFTMKSEVPFGPFLIASCLTLWIMQLYHIPLPFNL